MENKQVNGIVIIDKGEGLTSQGVVNRVKRLFSASRAGHTGTLDPMATGVLPVLVGRAVKASEYMMSTKKHYLATLRLGIATDTEDITGNITSESSNIPDCEAVMSAVEKFTGSISQIPPMYSAIKVNGKKLLDLARNGEVIERKPRGIEIFSIKATPTESIRDYTLDVHCSGGTYIRTLCSDIGNALGCGGCMKTLCRNAVGNFDISSSVTVEHIESLTDDEKMSLLIPTESLFDSLPCIALSPFFEKLCRSGCEIYQKKIRTDHPIGQRVRIKDENGVFFAIGEVREYTDGSAVKAIKTFVL